MDYSSWGKYLYVQPQDYCKVSGRKYRELKEISYPKHENGTNKSFYIGEINSDGKYWIGNPTESLEVPSEIIQFIGQSFVEFCEELGLTYVGRKHQDYEYERTPIVLQEDNQDD